MGDGEKCMPMDSSLYCSSSLSCLYVASKWVYMHAPNSSSCYFLNNQVPNVVADQLQ